jgi:hypothetical protein
MRKYIISLIIVGGLSIAPARGTELFGEVSAQELFPDLQKQQAKIAQDYITPTAKPCYRIQAQESLGILGYMFNEHTNRVMFVDPASDAFGVIFVGDQIVALDGMQPHQHWLEGKAFGLPGTTVRICWEHDGQISQMDCRRKPIEVFESAGYLNLNWRALGH